MKNKFLYVVMIIVIVLGAIMVKVKGFNYETLYSDHKRIEIVIGNEFDVKDISKIAKETIKEKSIVRKTTLFGTSVSIDAKNITDDEINNLFAKLNEKYSKSYDMKSLKKEKILVEQNATSVSSMSDEEITTLINNVKDKYGLEYTKEELQDTVSKVRMSDVSKVEFYDMLKGFILPLLISLAIVLVYYAVRFNKLYKKAWVLEPVKLALNMILSQAFLIAVVAITRIPVSQYIICVLLFVWILQIISETVKNEKALEKINVEE